MGSEAIVSAPSALDAKLMAVRSRRTGQVLDLFAGCGGLSLGFAAAGFEVVGGIEVDRDAALTHALNFHPEVSRHAFDVLARSRDIRAIGPDAYAGELSLAGDLDDHFDVIVGGPPCQAFARVGRAKLREVAAHPTAFLSDPRRNLYLRYLGYVGTFKPLALLMENVPDVINHGGHNIAHEVCEALEEMGYVARYTLLNAVYYGVPQMRDRMFLVAYHESVGARPEFPLPSRWIELPRGYEGTRQVALKHLAEDDRYYVAAPAAHEALPPAVTAEEAIGDLPPITEHLEGRLRRGVRRFTTLSRYRADVKPSAYAQAMRGWPGFASRAGVYDHVIRSLPRDYQIFAAMKPGDQYPEAYVVAERLFEQRLDAVERGTGSRPAPGSGSWIELRKKTVPPYDAGKFPNKWRKMERGAPARTLMAHIGKDTYSHIHHDSAQARTISVREAARLQSFPDGFRFSGAMNSAFRQIGNAVPPLIAKALAETMLHQLVAVEI